MKTRSSIPAVAATCLAAATVFGTTASAEAARQSTAAITPSLNIVSSNTMLLPSVVVDQWAQDFRGGLIGTSSYTQNQSNAQDLWVGFGVGAEGRTFPSDRLLVIE
ncbi:hypothetical protein [Streptomyces sp. NPDC057909]|uniref:hypothetical protein n=1 Tax=Streptomyces sp. NPDC057909 TaxID=3346277 RepID=UPI0036E5607F